MPTSRNARYLWHRAEYEHWQVTDQAMYGPVVQESVQPAPDAGSADLVTATHVVTDEVRLEPTHGHTPGHVSIHISSRGEEARITGDLMHHLAQCAHPEESSSADSDGAQAEQTRRDFLARYAGSSDAGHRHPFRDAHRRPHRPRRGCSASRSNLFAARASRPAGARSAPHARGKICAACGRRRAWSALRGRGRMAKSFAARRRSGRAARGAAACRSRCAAAARRTRTRATGS
ncbi:MAG: hypothetical protein U0802_24600 [Candidatus Binatia bacterium]